MSKEQSQAWAPSEFFPGGGKVDILLILFRLLSMQCTWTFTKRFTLSKPLRKCPIFGNSPKICVSLAAMLLFHSGVFSHRRELCGLLLSAVIVPLYYLLR